MVVSEYHARRNKVVWNITVFALYCPCLLYTSCVELIQNSFSDYLQGKVDYDKAKKNFETAMDKLIEMRLTAMADAFRSQLNDPKFKEIPFED